MNKLLIVFACFWCFSCATNHASPELIARAVSIVPKPLSVIVGAKALRWDASIEVIAKTTEERNVAKFVIDFFKTKNIVGNLVTEFNNNSFIQLTIVKNSKIGVEGYTLSSNEKGVIIQANTETGLFYGVQTFMQMVSINGKEIPEASITDYPRFGYRSLLLDVGRYMYPVSFIKRYIDLLAYHKFNYFHWHFTEDQGWRIEIKKYHRLQEVGAYRDQTVKTYARTKDRPFLKPTDYDGKRYGGYYTQEQIKEVVKYASARHVTIIPEIEMPGHATAALASYPHLGCTGGPYHTATTWGVFDDVFCAGNEETFTFLQGVLDEVIPLFPGQYIHIGGDECSKVQWENCPKCKKRIKEEKLKDTRELQSYFVQRIEKYVNSKGKKIIGWDEILEGGLAPNATVMSWKGEQGGIIAVQQKHTVIMSPTEYCYFDYYQDTAKTEPMAVKKYIPVSKVYSYEPIPIALTAAESKFILGAQANLWSEYLKDDKQVEYMTYPRACAMAEVVWSAKDQKDYSDFLNRMKIHFQRLDELKVNYAKHIKNDMK